MVSSENLKLHQMDVVTEFLSRNIEQNIYILEPQGFSNPEKAHLVCKLKKSLYELKKSPRLCHPKINHYLVDQLSFRNSPNNPCLQVRHDS